MRHAICGVHTHQIRNYPATRYPLWSDNGWVEFLAEPMKFLVDMLNHTHWLRIYYISLERANCFHFTEKVYYEFPILKCSNIEQHWYIYILPVSLNYVIFIGSGTLQYYPIANNSGTQICSIAWHLNCIPVSETYSILLLILFTSSVQQVLYMPRNTVICNQMCLSYTKEFFFIKHHGCVFMMVVKLIRYEEICVPLFFRSRVMSDFHFITQCYFYLILKLYDVNHKI